MKKLLDKLNIDETFTKPIKKSKKFNKVKDSIPQKEDYNFMSDVLHLPTDKKGYKYLLVVIDLATDEFDIQPMKNEDSKTTLSAMKTMFKRKHINKPYASLRTDGGSSFKKDVAKYLYNESIIHKVALAGRHSQVSSVESLNKTLGRLFNGYMNNIELRTGKVYREWTDIVDVVREELNAIRKKELKEKDYVIPDLSTPPKFKEGDMVYRQLDRPRNALNENLKTDQFREGDFRYDPIAVKVKQLLHYDGDVPYRYLLEGISNASFAEHQLMKAPDEESKGEIKEILEKRFFDGEDHYKLQLYGERKKDAGWYAKSDLLKTVDKKLLDDFDKSIKSKKKK